MTKLPPASWKALGKPDAIHLSSGTEIVAYAEVIGIGTDGQIYGGYDQYVTVDDSADRAALADMMIARWTAYKEAALEHQRNILQERGRNT